MKNEKEWRKVENKAFSLFPIIWIGAYDGPIVARYPKVHFTGMDSPASVFGEETVLLLTSC